MADTGTFPRAFEDKLNSALRAQAKEKLSRALSQADAISNDNTDKIAIMKDVVQPGKERAIKIAVQEIKKTDCREEKLAIVQRLTDRGITRDEIYQTQQEFKKSNDPNISR